MVKQYIHLDHYHPEYTEHEKERQKLHISTLTRILRLMIGSLILSFRSLYRILARGTHVQSRCVGHDLLLGGRFREAGIRQMEQSRVRQLGNGRELGRRATTRPVTARTSRAKA